MVFVLYKITLIYLIELAYFVPPSCITLLFWICSCKDKRFYEQCTVHMESYLPEVIGKEYKEQVYTQTHNTMLKPVRIKKKLPFSIRVEDTQTLWL